MRAAERVDMARLLRFYRGAVTWGDYDAMPHGDLVALQNEMIRATGGGDA